MRLSTSGHCSSGTRYSPGSWPWNNSEESTPGAFASAEDEPQVDRHAPHRRVLHGAGRDIAYAHFRVARHQGHDAQNDERADHVQPLPNLPHRYRFSLSVEGRPRRLAVALELRHQRVAGRKRLHGTQATDPFHLHRLAIHVAVEIEQMNLERARLFTKRRPGALIHHPAVPLLVSRCSVPDAHTHCIYSVR